MSDWIFWSIMKNLNNCIYKVVWQRVGFVEHVRGMSEEEETEFDYLYLFAWCIMKVCF